MKAHLRFFFGFLFSALLISSCNETQGPSGQADFLKSRNLNQAQKLKLLLLKGHPQLPLNKAARSQLFNLYAAFHFKPFFSSDSTHQTIKQNWLKTANKLGHFGLPKSRGQVIDKSQHELITELLISYQIGTIVHDLDSGFIDFDKRKLKAKQWQKYPSTWLEKSLNTDSILLTIGPADSNYRYFAQHLFHFCDTVIQDTVCYTLTPEKDNKNRAWEQLQLALLGKNLISAQADSLTIRAALRQFQKQNGLNADGRIGMATVYAFKQSKQDRLYHAQISLDRLRQQKPKPKTFIGINLPTFVLQFISDDTLRAEHRVIIGKIEHATPELSSHLNRIVSLPYWRVPSSIAKNEILPALKRNANYLQKEHMRIYGANKREIDPKMVNWKKIKDNTFPYRIEQDPGPWNSLGLIKFEFANAFSVYIHDTPSRSLFSNPFRSFSHGCMRTEAPIALGMTILNQDHIGSKFNQVSGDSLQKLTANLIHQKIPLLQPIPLFVYYQTVTADRDGLHFFLDLYQREQDLIKALRSGNNG